jgi:hypothetical protein
MRRRHAARTARSPGLADTPCSSTGGSLVSIQPGVSAFLQPRSRGHFFFPARVPFGGSEGEAGEGIPPSLYCSELIPNARAKPRVVTKPTTLPPWWSASGIIVFASMVSTAPPANASTIAIVRGEAASSAT